MKEIKRVLSHVRRALDDYDMIQNGDKIAVGVSGGKDSLTLLYALAEMRRFYPRKYELCAISVDMGFEGADFSHIAELCRELDVEYKIVKSEIYKVVFEQRKESNPCSLCAKMRRGSLNNAAVEFGCNKVALGHHFDDVVETFMLNLFYEGRIGCFSPVTYLSRVNIHVLRPMIYMPEKDISYFANKVNLPIIKSPCPANGKTERENMKQLLSSLEKGNRGLRYRIFGAITKGNIDGFFATTMEGMKSYEYQSDIKEPQNRE